MNRYTYAPDNEWFIETMSTVFSVGGDTMQPDIPNSFLKLLSEGEIPQHLLCVCCSVSVQSFDTDVYYHFVMQWFPLMTQGLTAWRKTGS